MPLSTSSFERALLERNKTKILLLGILFGVLSIFLIENLIRLKGGVPNVRDTAELWSSQRVKASQLSDDAIVLIGKSRIQLNIDLIELEKLTEKSPVQLAIDGSSFLEILEDIANDPQIKGTILLSTSLSGLTKPSRNIRTKKWISTYKNKYKNLWQPKIEQNLKAHLQSHSALYANIIPIEKLIKILITNSSLPIIYLTTLPNRERNADYSLVKMPDFYINRVLRELGQPLPKKHYKSNADVSNEIIKIAKKNYSELDFDEKIFKRTQNSITKLTSQGAKVVIINFPTSALVRKISDIRNPKNKWDIITKTYNVRVIDYRDYPELQFELPDGSHLDQTQKKKFTENLVKILKRPP